MKKSITNNIVFNLLKTCTSVVIPLFTYTYVARVLGAAGLGKVNFVNSIISYFQLFASLGISNYAISNGAKIRDEKDKYDNFCSEILFINLCTTFIAYILLVICCFFWDFLTKYKIMLLISGLNMFFVCMSIEWMYASIEEYKYISIRSIIIQVFGATLVFLLIHKEDDLLLYISVLLVPGFLTGIINLLNCKRFVSFSFVNICFHKIRNHLIPIFVIGGMAIASTIYINSDIIMLTYFKGDYECGLYSVGIKASHVVCLILNSISGVLLPRLSYYLSNGNDKDFKKLVNKTIDFIMIFTVPAMVGLFMLSENCAYILGGSSFSLSASIGKIMSINVLLSPLNNILATQLLIPLNKQSKAFAATVFGAVANIILNGIFIPRYGMFGAAISTIFSELIVLLYCFVCLNKFIGFSDIIHNIMQGSIASLSIIILCFFIKVMISNIYINTIVCVTLSVLAYYFIMKLLHNSVVAEVETKVLTMLRNLI